MIVNSNEVHEVDSPLPNENLQQCVFERLYDFSEAGKIQLIRSKGQLLSEEYVPEGIEVKAYVPQDIYGRL